jgi:hypothetical protein
MMVKSRRDMKDKVTEDTRYYIDKDAKKTLGAVRRKILEYLYVRH